MRRPGAASPRAPTGGTAVAPWLRLRHKPPMKPVVRFAPSPTGLIHIGNTRVALLNALYARREGGTFVLRYDDTDLARSKQEYADSIETDLHWLGIPPDVVVRQSER